MLSFATCEVGEMNTSPPLLGLRNEKGSASGRFCNKPASKKHLGNIQVPQVSEILL